MGIKNEYFNLIGQKSVAGKMILIAVVPENMLGENIPSIFEVQAVRIVPNIYSGTYPTIKVLSETMKDRSEDLKGEGVSGIITTENWFNVSAEDKNLYGINLNSE